MRSQCNRYFSSVDKLPKLPDPTGSLSTKVPLSSIVLANAGVKSMLKSLFMKGKGYVKLSPNVDNIGHSLTWSRYLHKYGIHAPSLQH